SRITMTAKITGAAIVARRVAVRCTGLHSLPQVHTRGRDGARCEPSLGARGSRRRVLPPIRTLTVGPGVSPDQPTTEVAGSRTVTAGSDFHRPRSTLDSPASIAQQAARWRAGTCHPHHTAACAPQVFSPGR